MGDDQPGVRRHPQDQRPAGPLPGQGDPTEAGTYRLLGHPVLISNRIADVTGTPNTGRAALVDFCQVAVARDQAPSVKVLDQTFGDYDQQALWVTARYDAAPLNPRPSSS
ncbi:hypothetical protein BH10ACT10_BH10ACT10_19160 [soil metagenome]